MHHNLKTILDSMPEGVLIFDKNEGQDVLYKNEKIEKLLGGHQSQFIDETNGVLRKQKSD